MPWEHTRRMRKEANLDPEFIASFLDIKEGEKIIDIGGGDGFFSLAFKKFTPNVYLLDVENWSGQDLWLSRESSSNETGILAGSFILVIAVAIPPILEMYLEE